MRDIIVASVSIKVCTSYPVRTELVGFPTDRVHRLVIAVHHWVAVSGQRSARKNQVPASLWSAPGLESLPMDCLVDTLDPIGVVLSHFWI